MNGSFAQVSQEMEDQTLTAAPFTMQGLASAIDQRPVLDDVSVVIPTLGRPILEVCLRRLAEGRSWPKALIVVDQGRKLEVSRWLNGLEKAGMETLYIPSSRHGRAAGVNRGLEWVKTRFVAITDDDCFAAPEWLAGMAARLRREPGAIVTGRVEPAGDQGGALSVVTSLQERRYVRPQWRVHPFIGGNAGLSMETVTRVGPFDEHPCLAAAEDSDYGYRALRLGIPIIYDPELVVFHLQWRDADSRAARYRDYARHQGGFYGKYLLRGGWLIPLQAGRDLVRGPVRWIRGILKRDRDMIDRGRADTLHLLPGILAGMKRRR
jgi:GT2 family glycosyltransferase